MSAKASARNPGEVIFHYDVERNSIPLSQFVDSARAAQEIIDDFNEKLFDKKVKYELHVGTPEEGSLIEVLMILVGIPGSILAFLGTDIGKALFKGLTTKEPAVWAEEAGEKIREQVAKRLPAQPPPEGQEVVVAPPDSATLEKETERHLEAEAIAFILVRFLELDIDRLRAIGVTPEKFRAAFNGRNRIFKGCIDNPEVQGIAFDREPNFEIKRSDFPRRITQLPDPPAEPPPQITDLNFETVDIVVNSPNWKRDGRNWQAATGRFQDVSFSIDDEAFWLRVERRDADLKPTIRDNMRVQWGYPAGATRPTHVKVLRVISYNGKQLSPPMSDAEIQALQAAVHFVEPEVPDLFDERRGSKDKNDKGGA